MRGLNPVLWGLLVFMLWFAWTGVTWAARPIKMLLLRRQNALNERRRERDERVAPVVLHRKENHH